jgi:hypothetical protein
MVQVPLHYQERTPDTELHQQKTFPSGGNGCVRMDALRKSRQRHPGGGLLCARRQYHASRSISPSNRRFADSSRSENLSSRSFYIKLEERRKKVRRYDTTRLQASTQLRGSTKSRKERVRPTVEKDSVCIFVV